MFNYDKVLVKFCYFSAKKAIKTKFRNALLLLNFEQSKCDIYLLLYTCDRSGYCYGGYAIATVVCGWYVDVFNGAAVWQCKFVV